MKRRKVTEGADSLLEEVKKYRDTLFRRVDVTRLRAAAYPFSAFLVSLLLAMVRGPAGTYPFAFSVFCASTGGVFTTATFLASILGAALRRDMERCAIVASVALVRVGISFFSGRLTRKPFSLRQLFCERGYLRLVLAALGAAAYGCVVIFESASIYYGLFSALLGIGMTVLSAVALEFLKDS